MHAQGHSPATSTNYSCKDSHENIWVSRSGIDKASILPDDFIPIDSLGNPLPPFQHLIPSAETAIHRFLYEHFPKTQVILHSHELYSVLASQRMPEVCFQGYELQKAFVGVLSHEEEVRIPIIPNSQDMNDILSQLILRKEALKYGLFSIENHGYYTWGTTLFEAKRSVEAFAYLCKVLFLINRN